MQLLTYGGIRFFLATTIELLLCLIETDKPKRKSWKNSRDSQNMKLICCGTKCKYIATATLSSSGVSQRRSRAPVSDDVHASMIDGWM